MRLPIATWPLILVLALAAAAIFLPPLFETKIWVPKGDVAVFTRIKAKQLRQVKKLKRDLDGSLVTARDKLLRRVATAPLAKEKPVSATAVTEVAPRKFEGLEPVAFHADATTTGEIATGKRVKLLFAPTAPTAGVDPLALPAILLRSEGVKAGGTDYLVALTRTDRKRLLEVVARSRLLVVPG